MSVVVISCGRTGTNVAVSLLSGSPDLNLDKEIENKTLFKKKKKYGTNYLAKCDVTYLDKFEQLTTLMNNNEDMKIVWTIRDPRDVIMSKIRRGQPANKGGDTTAFHLSADATPKGAIKSLTKMYNNYLKCKEKYPKRTFLVKMEDMLLDGKETAKKLSKDLEIRYHKDMDDFPQRMQNKYKIGRYGRKVDKNQVKLWKNWKTVYGGFFTNNKFNMDDHFNELSEMIKYFDYEEDRTVLSRT